MASQLKVTLGQHSDQGRKPTNQDFHGACIPTEPQLSAKGIALALADGISSSDVSRCASETAIKGFLEDYYCTSPAWSVKTSGQRVLDAVNAWLYSQTQQSPFREDHDRGYVCTFSALVLKSTTAHLFHVGDARIYRVHANALEQLTTDHRVPVSSEKHYLGRALGVQPRVEIDYLSARVEVGDIFVLATDGVYEFASAQFIATAIRASATDLDAAARSIVAEAFMQGSDDNLTVQIVRIDELPSQGVEELQQQLTQLPFPPELQPRSVIDGFRIVRELHSSARSHVFLAEDEATRAPVVIKIPSVDLRGNPAYRERFLLEEWIAHRIDSPHVLRAYPHTRQRSYVYTAMEYVEGQTLAQWMIDHPRPSLDEARRIASQIARGLQALHRLEMLHQDLRPANVMIDRHGTVKLIDFGSTRVAGVLEIDTPLMREDLLGTAQYTAPEYFIGELGTERSDLFSLAVIVYQMLSGRLPYGADVAKARTRAAQRRLVYRSVLADDREIPAWFDHVLRKATQIDPAKRHEALSEFVHDLHEPGSKYPAQRTALLERDPVLFWKLLSAALLIVVLVLLYRG